MPYNAGAHLSTFFNRLGIPALREMDREKFALMALRGDFSCAENLPLEDTSNSILHAVNR